MHAPDLVVFCHLRWNFVYQRPQHLLSTLAADRRVFVIEEPIHDAASEGHWERNWPAPNVCVLKPHTPLDAPGFNEQQFTYLRPLVEQLVKRDLKRHVAWFYTPLALPLLDALAPEAVVYDCMDELSSFLHAPPSLVAREAELLERADVVFTGGPSLYRAKKNRHPNVHCFPSSVDAAHFARARADHQPPLQEPSEQRDLPHPRLGFYGVIDERFDTHLLDKVAEARPQWQFMMVGPTVKIDPQTLPRRPNIHYTGQQEYAKLPEFLAGWDVCLLPFARNESTRFISPTKTLEYMAAERPIVSTPITDVAEPYGDFVYLGDTPEAFLQACEAALSASPEERTRRVERMREVLGPTSWKATAHAMSEFVAQAIERRHARVAAAAARQERTPRVVVIGAGPTGLSAAYHLGPEALLIERNDRVGGWCRSIVDRGFTFDHAGHIMFSNDPYVHELYTLLLGDNVHWQNREAWIYSHNVYTRYPFQGALYGLPPQVIKECLVGALEARFGSLKTSGSAAGGNGNGNGNGNGSANGNGHSKHATNGNGNGNAKACSNGNGANVPKGEGDSLEDCCGDGVLESTTKLAEPALSAKYRPEPQNFYDFIHQVWGAGIAKHFAIPYNKKLWTVDLKEMETSWLGGRVPLPDLEEMIDGALRPVGKPMGPNARFGYPLRGGFQALMDGFLPHLEGPVWLNCGVASVSPTKHTVTLQDGRTIAYEKVISTMPLPVLVQMAGDEAPREVQRAARGLRFVSVRCVNLGIGRENLTEKHWIYYPEDTVFHRIFVQGNASPHCNPPGGFGLTCEITHSPHKPLPCDGQALIDLCIEDCRRVGIINADDPIWATNQVDMPHAYVVYDHARLRHVQTIRRWLGEHDIILAGRYSEWEYYNSDHAFLAGKRAAEACRHPLGERSASIAFESSPSLNPTKG
jgi:UDP-galactopyranose mutase